jgi:LysM repeat protein
MINQPPYIIPFDTTKVNDGAYVLDALAYDALSNQGEAPRLNIGIANNTINPTYIGSASTPGDSPTPSAKTTNSTNNTDSSTGTDTTPTSTSSGNTNTTPDHPSNTTVASTQTAPVFVPLQPAAPTLIPQQPRQGALNDNNGGGDNFNNDNGSSLMVEVQSSAQVQRSAPEAQPRVTDLPMRFASNDAPAQPVASIATPSAPMPTIPPVATLAQPSLFASSNETSTSSLLSLSNEQPLTTIAETKMAALPNTIKTQAQATETSLPVREAKLPELPVFNNNTAIENSARQSPPISTLINTLSPHARLSQSTFEQVAPQRYFQVNDALSMPQDKKSIPTSANVKNASVPVFPKASLNPRPVKTLDKSTFTAPFVGMTNTKVLSRMAQANPGSHISASLMANAQIGALPGYVAPKAIAAPAVVSSSEPLFTTSPVSMTNTRMAQANPGNHISTNLMANVQIGALPGYVAPKPVLAKPVSAAHHIVSSHPLFTVPDISMDATSRIASANISGKSWRYQHNAQKESGQSTKPQIAFLPKFNSKTKVDSFASITISPVSTKMQVSEMSQSWPAVYQARQQEELSAIAARYGLPVEVLAKNNNLKKGAILTAGQKIKMPRNLQVTYNGKALHSDVRSMLVGTTSVAAFRFLFEQQGGKVSWDSANQTVRAKNGDSEITLTIGSDQAMVNQKTVMMDMAAFLLSGRTMVPVRLFEKSLNAHVTWDPSTGRMFMAMAG